MELIPILCLHLDSRILNILSDLFPEQGSDICYMGELYDILGVEFMKVEVYDNNTLFLRAELMPVYALLLKL